MKKTFFSLFNWQSYSVNNNKQKDEMQNGKNQGSSRSRVVSSLPTPQPSPPLQSPDLKKPPELKVPPKQSTVYNPTISSLSKTATVIGRPRLKRPTESENSSTKVSIESSSTPTPKPQSRNPFKSLFPSTKQSTKVSDAPLRRSLNKSVSKEGRKFGVEELRSSLPRPKSYMRVSSIAHSQDLTPGETGKVSKSTPNLRGFKSVNNNDLWVEPKNIQEKNSSDLNRAKVGSSQIPTRGHHTPTASKQSENSTLKGAASISSLDSKHHKIAPTKEKSSKVFGSKDKLHKSKKKDELSKLTPSSEALNEDEKVQLPNEMEVTHFEQPRVSSLKRSKNNNKIEFSSADELSYTRTEKLNSELYKNNLSSSCRLEKATERLGSSDDLLGHQEFASLPPMPMDISTIEDIPINEPTQEVTTVDISQFDVNELKKLRIELETLAEEKSALQNQVKELLLQVQEMADVKKELAAMKTTNERVTGENAALRARLRGVAHSPLSDSEKRQLLQDAGHSSGPTSMPTETDGEVLTPEWDKHSSSSLSEVSVACLQDRILQMEENHYSTNEELQATLQELADLQTQLNELQVDNERLSDEKAVLLESLCTQTEKLEDTRTKADTLQGLLLREGSEQDVHSTEREQKLVMILKSAQSEKETLLLKQEEISVENSELRETLDSTVKENERLHEKLKNMENAAELQATELKQIQIELSVAKDLADTRYAQLQHVSGLYDAASLKITTLENNITSNNVDQQTAALQRQNDLLQEQLSALKRQHDQVAHRCSQLQDEAVIAKDAAKCALAELELQCDLLKKEKEGLETNIKIIQEENHELQLQNQCLTDERRAFQNSLNESQKATVIAEQKCRDIQTRLTVEISERERDAAEWKQFQSDLLLTVRVANDFKTEAQRELEKLVLENRAHRERIRALENQIEQQKVSAALPSIPRSASVEESSHITAPPLITSASLQDIMAQSVQRRNNKANTRQDTKLSVKSLIESIENVAKQKAGTGLTSSLASSTSSFSSLISGENFDSQSAVQQHSSSPLREQTSPTELIKTSNSPLNNGNSVSQVSSPITSNGYINTSPLGKPPPISRNHRNLVINDQMKQDIGNNQNHATGVKSSTISSLSGNKLSSIANMTDDQTSSVHSLLHNNKALETFVRRNSYGDLTDRKDPLNGLVKNGGSKRNALLKWCQNKTVGYRNIEITNFSSSWNDGLALCALLHTYLPSLVPYDSLPPCDKKHNFSTAFAAAESVGIPTTLNIQDMIQMERPDWQQVMAYVTAIYKHFET